MLRSFLEIFSLGVMMMLRPYKQMAGDMMTLKSSDDQIFEVKLSVATILLQNVFEDLDIAQPVFLPNVTGRTLSKVIEYLNFHDDVNNRAESLELVPEIDVQAWDREFVQVDQATLFDYILVSPSHFSISLTRIFQ